MPSENEEMEWHRGIKIQKKLASAVESTMHKLGMIPPGVTEMIKYCLNRFIEESAFKLNISGKLS